MMLWGIRNWESIQPLFIDHIWLSLIPTILGLALSIPLGLLVHGHARIRRVVIVLASITFTIPSLALFVIIPAIIGTPILSSLNVIIALSLYSIALQIRSVLEALDSIPESTNQAATAVGFSPTQRSTWVELPLMVPVLSAGTRVVAATNVSMVSVGALIGVGGLGQLFTAGYQRDFPEEILTGIVLILILAIVYDRIIALIARALTPWQRGATSAQSDKRLRKLASSFPEVPELQEAVK